MDTSTLRSRAWREIPGCPGRSVFRGVDPELDALARAHASRHPGVARDVVLLWVFPEGGGLLSYERADGRLVHTLNDDAGLRRKCAALGIALPV